MGCVANSAAASTSFCAALNSPSAWIIFERFSRSASACLAMARSICSGRSTCFTSTEITFTPKGSVRWSMMDWMRRLSLSRWLSNSSSSTSPSTDRSVVWIDDVERDHSVHLDGDVVARDDVLGRHLKDFLTERDAHHLVERAE